MRMRREKKKECTESKRTLGRDCVFNANANNKVMKKAQHPTWPWISNCFIKCWNFHLLPFFSLHGAQSAHSIN